MHAICGWPMIVGMMVASFDVLVININIIFVWHIDTTSQKFLNSKIFYVFFKNSLLLNKPAFIWSISSNIAKYYYHLKNFWLVV